MKRSRPKTDNAIEVVLRAIGGVLSFGHAFNVVTTLVMVVFVSALIIVSIGMGKVAWYLIVLLILFVLQSIRFSSQMKRTANSLKGLKKRKRQSA